MISHEENISTKTGSSCSEMFVKCPATLNRISSQVFSGEICENLRNSYSKEQLLTQSMPPVTFYTPWKHKKPSVFKGYGEKPVA